MPRPLRVQVDGALYYVTAAGFPGRPLFRDRQDFEAYLELLQEYQQRHGFTLYAYTLLPESVHLLLELPEGGSLSDVMHDLSSRYTKHANRRYAAAGHLFQQRFKSAAAEKSSWLLRLSAYVHLLPQFEGAASDALAYAWSSVSQYLDPVAPGPGARVRVVAREVLDRLAVERPGVSCADLLRGTSPAFWEETERQLRRPAVGSDAFLADVTARQRQARNPAPQPAAVERAPDAQMPARQHPSFMVTGSLAVAALSLAATITYAKNLDQLRRTVLAMAVERNAVTAVASPQETIAARLISFANPTTLAGMSWNIELRPTQVTGDAPLADRLSFDNGKLTSAMTGAEGFAPSRYTVRRGADGAIEWETMQADAKGTVVSWRGTSRGAMTHGTMTRQAAGRAPESYSFVGTAPRGVVKLNTSET